jgi:hypothetical protein
MACILVFYRYPIHRNPHTLGLIVAVLARRGVLALAFICHSKYKPYVCCAKLQIHVLNWHVF